MPFLASFAAIAVTVVAAIVPTIDLSLPNHGPERKGEFPAPPGYLLPWTGGEIHAVTQGEETKLTHNGSAAYAFDFDLSYETVVAARAGKVMLIRSDSNSGGCNAMFSSAANYVVIDHGDGTSGLYLHLAFDSVLVKPGDIVEQGQPIAISGETGLTCSDLDNGPGPHLHFQVERTEENRYFTQSLPIAFDDISSDNGVPQEGRSYMAGNYGSGKPQKIKLTPWRVPREFNPVAQPENPALLEADHVEVPPAIVPSPTTGEQPDSTSPGSDGGVVAGETASPDSSRTPRPTRTPTMTPVPSQTPVPAAATDTPLPPAPTDTPLPATATDTPVPAPSPTDTPAPPPPSPSVAAEDTATAEPPPAPTP